MEDALKKLFYALTRQRKQKYFQHQPTDTGSESTAHQRPVARPHISLKARMLGGQAKTIMRLGGSMD
jgi:hypothetical protein